MTTTEAALRDARKIAATHWRKFDSSSHRTYADEIEAGQHDECEAVAVALAALSQPSPASSTAGEDDYKRGIYAAKCWLRDQQHKNPPDSLWHAAAILADRMDVALLSSSGEPASVAVEAGNHSPTFEDHQQALLSLYRSKDADIARLREFMTTLFVNAKKKPDDMTADLVAFMCDAALKNCTVTLAADKWQAEPAALSKPTPVEAGLGEALERLRIMAKQKLSSELDEEDQEWADWQGAYDFFCTESRAILAALSETQPVESVAFLATTWQPIETAPKDGSHFLATTIVRNTTTGKQWWETHVIWVDDETGELSADCNAGWSYLDDYTHWQPLPAAPVTE